MRQFTDGDRLFGNESTASLKDALDGTLVLSGTGVTQASSTTIDVASGRIVISGTPQNVSANSGIDLSPLPSSGNVRYDTVSRDSNGSVVVTTGTEGSTGSDVGAPDRPAGNVYLAVVRLLDSGIDTVFDGRSLWDDVPNEAVEALVNFSGGDVFSGYPIADADVDESTIDAGNLGGSGGSSGQILESDGSNANWVALDRVAVRPGTLGDVTRHRIQGSSSSPSGFNSLVNTSSETVFLGGQAIGDGINGDLRITVDGNTTSYSGSPVSGADGNSDSLDILAIPPVYGSSDINVEVKFETSYTEAGAIGWSR